MPSYGSQISEIRKALMKGNKQDNDLQAEVRERMFTILKRIADNDVRKHYGGYGGKLSQPKYMREIESLYSKRGKYGKKMRKRSSSRMRSGSSLSSGYISSGGRRSRKRLGGVYSGGVRSGGKRRKMKRGGVGSGGKRAMNPWLKHLRAYHKAHPNLTYRQAMMKARATYRG